MSEVAAPVPEPLELGLHVEELVRVLLQFRLQLEQLRLQVELILDLHGKVARPVVELFLADHLVVVAVEEKLRGMSPGM